MQLFDALQPLNLLDSLSCATATPLARENSSWKNLLAFRVTFIGPRRAAGISKIDWGLSAVERQRKEVYIQSWLSSALCPLWEKGMLLQSHFGFFFSRLRSPVTNVSLAFPYFSKCCETYAGHWIFWWLRLSHPPQSASVITTVQLSPVQHTLNRLLFVLSSPGFCHGWPTD